ncbi:MAG: SMP-30/gluconolactonase/LRE family protein [Myxococcota bacterium]|nr:SMP-30/gluconolactonase/LRE family protein [Myxococcota bacterium]
MQELGPTRTLLDGLAFGEGPRWHEGRLWFSDMHHHQVIAVDESGKAEVQFEVPHRPSGLGWLPDGRLLVVSMTDRKLLVREGDVLRQHADLRSFASWHCNDMLVDDKGRAYVGNFGFDLDGGAKPCHANLIRVDPDGAVSIAAEEMSFPNGTVLTPDGRTLIVGESFGTCLTAFDVAPDGSLSNRRVWATLTGATPDGICLDAEGAVWVASPISGEVLRVREGGEVTHGVGVEHQAFACMLGGDDGRTLFICTAKGSDPEATVTEKAGRIETIRVDVPHAGLP